MASPAKDPVRVGRRPFMVDLLDDKLFFG